MFFGETVAEATHILTAMDGIRKEGKENIDFLRSGLAAVLATLEGLSGATSCVPMRRNRAEPRKNNPESFFDPVSPDLRRTAAFRSAEKAETKS